MRNEPPLDFDRGKPDSLDALIDSAARQMLSGEPSASLRGAVRDRVEHRRSPWLLAPAVAGAAAVLVIASVLVGRTLLLDPVGRTLSGPAGERDNVRPTIELAGTPGAPDKARPTIEETLEHGSQAPPVRLARRLADDVAALPQEEEALIPPIAIEPLVPFQIAIGDPITVESSGVMPIEIEPLQIEPLRSIE